MIVKIARSRIKEGQQSISALEYPSIIGVLALAHLAHLTNRELKRINKSHSTLLIIDNENELIINAILRILLNLCNIKLTRG